MAENEKPCIKFNDRASIIVSAPTGSGKTDLIVRILIHRKFMFSSYPKKILYCYRFYQEIFDHLQQKIPDIEFHLGIPSESEIQAFSNPKEHRLIVIDDLATDLVNSYTIENLVTSACHHQNLSCILVIQNLFPKGRVARTLLLNCTYTILFQNIRDRNQIKTLGSRLYPGKSENFLEIYDDACTKRKFGYLLIDTSPTTEANLRLRTYILPDEREFTNIYEI